MEKVYENVSEILNKSVNYSLIKCKCSKCFKIYETTKRAIKKNQQVICSSCKRKEKKQI